MYKIFFIIFFSISFIFSNNLQEKSEEKWKVNLIPGIGQIKNKKYIKAALLFLSQSYSIYKCLEYNSDHKIAKRNTYAWWFVGLYFYGIIDSYVDYSFKDFPNESDNKEKE